MKSVVKSVAAATLLAGTMTAAMIVDIAPAAAQETYPTEWCSTTSGVGTECYQNLAQCQQNIEGIGGFCAPTRDWKPSQPLGYGEFPQRPNE
jgi:hypothetical protein